MEGLLEPEEVEETVGTVEVRETFKASRVGTIAGSYVTEGTVRRGAQCRLVRDGTIVYDGRIGSLRRFKDDVREVTAGHRVRHRARELPRREGGGRDRGLRDEAGRADTGLSFFVCLVRDRAAPSARTGA